jgi:glucose-1-phosphate adenylyltransferase
MDYRKFLDRHYETNADVTISVVPARQQDAGEFGLLKTDESGKIVEFKEKPKGEELESMRVDTTQFGLSDEEAERRPFLASMGIYIFNYQHLLDLLATDTSWVDFGRELIPAAIHRCNVQAHVFDHYWEDIGTIRSFYNANLDLASPLPKFNFFNTEAPIYTRSRHLPPSKIHNCDIDNSMVSEGCILNGIQARNSIIGLRSRIGAGARIENSIVMGSDYYESLDEIKANLETGRPHIGIGANSIIRNSIVDKNVRIGRDVQLVNKNGIENLDSDNGCYYIREGLVIIPKNSVIEDGTVI